MGTGRESRESECESDRRRARIWPIASKIGFLCESIRANLRNVGVRIAGLLSKEVMSARLSKHAVAVGLPILLGLEAYRLPRQ